MQTHYLDLEKTEAGGDDRSDSPNISGGSEGSGAWVPTSRSRGRADGGVQEVEEGAKMILKLEKSPLITWKKGRGGRRERRKREREIDGGRYAGVRLGL